MKVLLYIDPLVEREKPRWKQAWLAHHARRMVDALRADGIHDQDLAIVVGDGLADDARQLYPEIRIGSLPHALFVPGASDDALALAIARYRGTVDATMLAKLGSALCASVTGFEPDVVLVWAPAPEVRAAWPAAVVLHWEYGMFSRAPYPEICYLDPVGMFQASALAVQQDAIRAWKNDTETQALVERVREHYRPRVFGAANPVARLFEHRLSAFDRHALLSLQFSNFYAYDAHATYRSQYDLLVATLDAAPRNVAVVVIEHPEHPLFDEQTFAHLSAVYPNLVWDPALRQIYAASQCALACVDTVVTVSSSVGFQAAFWGKRLIIVGSSHLDLMADSHSLEDLAVAPAPEAGSTRDGIFGWMLTRYYVPFEILFGAGNFTRYLQRAIAAGKQRVGFDWFVPVAPLSALAAAYCHGSEVHFKDVAPPADGGVASGAIRMTFYAAGQGQAYSEERRVSLLVPAGSPDSIRVPVMQMFPGTKTVRLDPGETIDVICLRALRFLAADGRVVSEWNNDPSDEIATTLTVLGPVADGSALLLCGDSDPWLEFSLPAGAESIEISAGRPSYLALQKWLQDHAALERDKLAALAASLRQRESDAAGLQMMLAEREARIESNVALVAELEAGNRALVAEIDRRGIHLRGLDERLHDLTRELAQKDGLCQELSQGLARRDQQIDLLLHEALDRNRRLDSVQQTLAQRNMDVQRLNNNVADLFGSTSWRVTRPLRFVSGLLKGDSRYSLRSGISRTIRGAWATLPFNDAQRRRLKHVLFTFLPFLFAWSGAYRNWKAAQEAGLMLAQSSPAVPSVAGSSTNPYVELLDAAPLTVKPARLICFYLPQFHPIAENNAWWGEGFTEWTNVQPAQPQFEGHYQPHVPGELGYYNLLDPAVQRRQVDLAKLYGIEGFCFYFYWFGGKRLLEQPIENYLNDSSLDLPFCLCWANENWSRRWDGLDKEILIAQNHSPEDDIGFISHVAKYMADPRYIRIDGRPLLLVYRPSLLPNAAETAARWRAWCRNNGLGEIYLACTQSFEKTDPLDYGFDAAIEFPPNNSSPPDITAEVQPLGNFQGTVYDWRIFPKRSEAYQQPGYTLFRSVCPSWDNTARRKNRGTIFQHSSPAEYRRWLANAIDDTVKQRASPDERLVFVNAWNEWAEGAHLEPDARYGYAFLQATRDALAGSAATPATDASRRIIVVTHDAYPHGAQLLALNLARTLNSEFGFAVELVCLGDGPLKAEYAKWATVHDLAGRDQRGPEAIALAEALRRDGVCHAIVNTTASGSFVGTLKGAGIACVALVHELRGVLDQLGLHEHAKVLAANADAVVFPASCVAESFSLVAPLRADAIVVRPQGLYKRRKTQANVAEDREQLRARLGLPKNCRIVLGVGYADHRKGIDLFVEAGIRFAERLPDARWVWIGHWEQTMQVQIERTLARHPHLKDHFVFPGLQSDTDLFYGGADLFALTSREDPYPSVVLEAMDAGVPVIAFEGSGGITELVADGGGLLVRMADVDAFGAAVAQLLGDEQQRLALGLRGKEIVAARFSFRHYLFDLLDLLGAGLKRVSVVVPNYNYERYLPERLGSIFGQTYPAFEIIFLDDRSTDGSLARAREILAAQPVDYRIVANERNSGSVFAQWKRGVDLARGSQVWIAEADDVAHPEFLATATRGFAVPGMAVSYCESRQIDGEGRVMADNYLDYVADISAEKWRRPYIGAGIEEIRTALAVKNTIPNVSAVLFDRRCLQGVLDRHIEEIRAYRVAGDWLVYVLMLADGKISFSPRPLNDHRRHAQGVTISGLNESQLEEIRSMQRYVAEKFAVPAAVTALAGTYIETLKARMPTG